MIGLGLCIFALMGTFIVARRSLVYGIVTAIAFGYFYGILRANFFETASHFIFDGAVLGLYLARVGEINRTFATKDGQRFKHWVTLLLAVPVVMFFVPMQDFLVQLVGLRGNAYLIPFLLIGAILTRDDWYRLALWFACLNLVAFFFGSAEYAFGVERFFPYNTVTDIIYRSNDVGIANNLRIPAVFGSAHVYGGTMVLTLPILVNAWVQRHREVWHKNLLIAGMLAAILGVFMSAARIHFVVLVVLLTVATVCIRMRPVYRVGWVVLLLTIGYIVSTQDRMQRFTTLDNQQFIENRLEASVNTTLFDVMVDYPFGNGLGGGGTSIPFFLADRLKAPVAVESEWGRIELETGLIGLASWCGFLLWVFTRPQANRGDPAFLGMRLAWFAALCFFASGFVGIGLFTSIPQTAILLMLVGWVANHHTGEADRRTSAPRAPGAPMIHPMPLPMPQRELIQR